MKVKAHLKNLRISPRKVRLVADLIRGLEVSEAKAQLSFLIKRSSLPLLKLLNSAIANAKHNFKLDENNLYIAEIFVNEGPTLKRIMPRAMGRAFQIRKRTSHVTIVLEEINKSDKVDNGDKKASKADEDKDLKKTVKKKTVKKVVEKKKETKKVSKKSK